MRKKKLSYNAPELRMVCDPPSAYCADGTSAMNATLPGIYCDAGTGATQTCVGGGGVSGGGVGCNNGIEDSQIYCGTGPAPMLISCVTGTGAT